jgi:hypothetical protein
MHKKNAQILFTYYFEGNDLTVKKNGLMILKLQRENTWGAL